MGVNILGVEWG